MTNQYVTQVSIRYPSSADWSVQYEVGKSRKEFTAVVAEMWMNDVGVHILFVNDTAKVIPWTSVKNVTYKVEKETP